MDEEKIVPVEEVKEEPTDAEVVEAVVDDVLDKGTEVLNSANELVEKVKEGERTFLNVDWMSIPPATYTRWVLAFIAALNTILTSLHVNPISFSEDRVYAIVSILFNVAVLFMNTYKNNSTSREAIFADKLMRTLKDVPDDMEHDIVKSIGDIFKEINK